MANVFNSIGNLLKKVPWKWVLPTAGITGITVGKVVANEKDKEQHEKNLLTAKQLQKITTVNDALTEENHQLNDSNEKLREALINRISEENKNE